MSRGRGNNGPKLDLKLNLSPPIVLNQATNLMIKASSWTTSTETSCLSSEMEDAVNYSSSPDEAASMVLVGCPRCLMYVMLSGVDPKCPRCKSSVLLRVFNSHENKTTTNKRN